MPISSQTGEAPERSYARDPSLQLRVFADYADREIEPEVFEVRAGVMARNLTGSSDDKISSTAISLYRKELNKNGHRADFLQCSWAHCDETSETTTIDGGHVVFEAPSKGQYLIPLCAGHNRTRSDKYYVVREHLALKMRSG